MSQSTIHARVSAAALTLDRTTKKTGAAKADRVADDRAKNRDVIKEREAKIKGLEGKIEEEENQGFFEDLGDFLNPFDTTSEDYMNETSGVKADIVKAEKQLRLLKEEQKDVFAELQASADNIKNTNGALDEMLEDAANTNSINR